MKITVQVHNDKRQLVDSNEWEIPTTLSKARERQLEDQVDDLSKLCHQAADVLKPFAMAAKNVGDFWADDEIRWSLGNQTITLGHLRAALKFVENVTKEA